MISVIAVCIQTAGEVKEGFRSSIGSSMSSFWFICQGVRNHWYSLSSWPILLQLGQRIVDFLCYLLRTMSVSTATQLVPMTNTYFSFLNDNKCTTSDNTFSWCCFICCHIWQFCFHLAFSIWWPRAMTLMSSWSKLVTWPCSELLSCETSSGLRCLFFAVSLCIWLAVVKGFRNITGAVYFTGCGLALLLEIRSSGENKFDSMKLSGITLLVLWKGKGSDVSASWE